MVSPEKEAGGGGGWHPKVCVPKMARINISFCTLHFSAMKSGSGGGGGGEASLSGAIVHRPCNSVLVNPPPPARSCDA